MDPASRQLCTPLRRRDRAKQAGTYGAFTRTMQTRKRTMSKGRGSYTTISCHHVVTEIRRDVPCRAPLQTACPSRSLLVQLLLPLFQTYPACPSSRSSGVWCTDIYRVVIDDEAEVNGEMDQRASPCCRFDVVSAVRAKGNRKMQPFCFMYCSRLLHADLAAKFIGRPKARGRGLLSALEGPGRCSDD